MRLDKFYTKPHIVSECISKFEEWTSSKIENYDFILEPSAGSGFFLDQLPNHTQAIDIFPEDKRIVQGDFLETFFFEPGLVIGNPPFGKNSSLAVKFFNHAAGFADLIAFILPRTFEKTSIQDRLDLNFHLIGQLEIGPDAFLSDGTDYDVPCVFQVWERRSIKRNKTQKLFCDDFDFSTCDNADFSFQRVGVNAGRIKDSLNVSKSSHYFIKGNNKGVRDIFEKLEFSDEKLRTAGNPSISKSEIIEKYIHMKNSLI